MKELDLLKRDWNKNNHSFEQLTDVDIYKMLHKKSSSIVKWILLISIAEFVLLRGLDFVILFDEDYISKMKFIHLYNFEVILTAVNLVVLITFIFLFYKNFRTINAASSIKKLMKDIINTRKMVKYYVAYNLILVAISTGIILFSEIRYNNQLMHFYDQHHVAMYVIAIGVIGFLSLLFWLFYRLLYGILLSRLQRNYKELKKIDL